jgi:periplasmic copper chaperone A
VLSAVVALLALGAGPAAASGDSDLVLSGAYMRFIIPARPAAGYFSLKNNGDQPRLLTGASSPACGSLMLHKSMSENGMEMMMPVDSVAVPAHGTIAFSPGAYHLMCMSPSMKPGDSVPVTLKFKDGGSLTGTFAVRGATGQ